MKDSIFLSVAIFGCIAFIYSHKDFFFKQFPPFSANSTFSFSNRLFPNRQIPGQIPTKPIQTQNRRYKPQIRRDLYNSISEGMSYDEVRSIIGWDGVLIYTNNLDYSGKAIEEKIYQWNDRDTFSPTYNPQGAGDLNPYWSVTLQFQDDALIGKSFHNLQQPE